MRIAGPDVVLFTVGLLLFSGSVYGLVQMDGLSGGGAPGAYSIEWSQETAESTITSFQRETSLPFEFTVDEQGVTSVIVTVACRHTPQVPNNVAADVTVELTGPNGLTGEQRGKCGSDVTVEIPTAEEPQSGTVNAKNQADAEEQARAAVDDNAVGAWSGTATFSTPSGAVGQTLAPYGGEIKLTLQQAVPRATATTR